MAWALLKKFCYDKSTQQLLLKKSQALPVRRDVISSAMDESIMPFKFKNSKAAMLYADTELKRVLDGTVSLNNALNKLLSSRSPNAVLPNTSEQIDLSRKIFCKV